MCSYMRGKPQVTYLTIIYTHYVFKKKAILSHIASVTLCGFEAFNAVKSEDVLHGKQMLAQFSVNAVPFLSGTVKRDI